MKEALPIGGDVPVPREEKKRKGSALAEPPKIKRPKVEKSEVDSPLLFSEAVKNLHAEGEGESIFSTSSEDISGLIAPRAEGINASEQEFAADATRPPSGKAIDGLSDIGLDSASG